MFARLTAPSMTCKDKASVTAKDEAPFYLNLQVLKYLQGMHDETLL
jgi:hypothetical protein